ncbi:MAG: hypothetical protein ACW99G_04805 [Candidatus Thorarchaeota archaeon]|jgi:hypothetical protein
MINFDNVKRVYVGENTVTVSFIDGEQIPFGGEEADKLRIIMKQFDLNRRNWHAI